MSDLKKLQADMERPLSVEAANFFRFLDENEFISLIAHFVPVDPLNAVENAKVRFEYVRTEPTREITELIWSPKLEEVLWKRKIRMASLAEEAARGGTLLLSNLRYPDVVFGKDYTDYVLWEVLSERFPGVEAVDSLLRQISYYKPADGPAHDSCKEYLKSAVNGLGNSLVLFLGYPNKEAYPVLVGAVVYMLDQRHHFTLRRMLFPQA